jgi:hypothetical protein
MPIGFDLCERSEGFIDYGGATVCGSRRRSCRWRRAEVIRLPVCGRLYGASWKASQFGSVSGVAVSAPMIDHRRGGASMMRPESRALGQALLDHHRQATMKAPPGKKVIPARYTIRYGDLCSRAGVPHLTKIVGGFLQEVAEWCANAEFPPLNALAVNDTGMPGDGYDGAGGFTIVNWPAEVETCIRFPGYPAKMP